jgi:phosphate transport system permease protein
MNDMSNQETPTNLQSLKPVDEFSTELPKRHRIGRVWLSIFQFSTLVGIIALTVLIINVTNSSSGYVAFETSKNPDAITGGVPIETLSHQDLLNILQENLSANRYRTINNEKPITERSIADLRELVVSEVIKPKVVKTWSLSESIFRKSDIEQEVVSDFPDAYLQFRLWLTGNFIVSPQSSNPLIAGIRTAILGSIWIIFITIIVALPIGVGAAIYLEEYARPDRWINRMIQTNINNLAAVPSIIYGILGLTIFVRVLEPITSGSLFGFTDPGTTNGRTILSGGLTLAILVLPLIIINAQEAIRAVPNSLRHASYGVGATKWQTIWSHVLPNAIPGILTGAVLALSRAFGETAPLLVVGVSTYITQNPTGFFSKFTTLPAQIYQWTARPQAEWRNIAAAAIIVLLVLLLLLNSVAILLRNKYSRKYV